MTQGDSAKPVAATFEFEGRPVAFCEGDTVLDALDREGVAVSSSCRAGACQSCTLIAQEGTVASAALISHRSRPGALVFLSCQQPAVADLVISRGEPLKEVGAQVDSVLLGTGRTARIWLRLDHPLGHLPGQFVQCVRPADGVFRSYSIASLPGEGLLELHVTLFPSGQLSPWLHSGEGERLLVRGPLGSCVDDPTGHGAPLILAGIGSGAAPLWAILRAAIRRGHDGPIFFLHGATRPEDLYLMEDLSCLEVPNLELIFSSLTGQVPGQDARVHKALPDQVLEIARRALAHPEGRRTRLFLCGDPKFVRSARRDAYLEGLSLDNIRTDAFEMARSG